MLSTESFTELVQEVAELAVRTVEPVVTCGITLAQQDRVFTVAAADELANQLDEQQYELDTGPCLQALASGQITLDLSGLEVLSAAGLTVFLRADHTVRALGGRLLLTRPTRMARRVLAITELDTTLNIQPVHRTWVPMVDHVTLDGAT